MEEKNIVNVTQPPFFQNEPPQYYEAMLVNKQVIKKNFLIKLYY